jgi:RNA polymerase sigma factor (sigma-70 family)
MELPKRKESPISIEVFCKKYESIMLHNLKQESIAQIHDPHKLYFDVIQHLFITFKKDNLHSESYIWEVFKMISTKILRKHKKRMDKNFGLSEDTFNILQQKLQDGDRTLFEKVFLSNFEDCLLFVQRKHQLQRSDAYDITMDALLLLYQKLFEGKVYYGNLRFLFLQMANQIYLKQQQGTKTYGYLDEIGIELPNNNPHEDAKIVDLLNKALNKLCDNCRKLMTRIYYEGASMKKIAEDQGKKPEAIRKQKQRCMEKLRKAFQEVN